MKERPIHEDRLDATQWEVRAVETKIAQAVVIEKHYLHRRASCSQAFGLYRKGDDEMRGVIMYGTPSNRNLRTGICGPSEQLNVTELTRLWVDDSAPRNGESFLIGRTLPLVTKEIVVSYADPTQGHLGRVYQATNWLYTGLSAKRPEYTVEGLEHLHKQSLFDQLGRGGKGQVKKLESLYGDRLKRGQQVRKHRYVTFVADRRRRRELRALLRYPVLPYPKYATVDVDGNCSTGV